MWSRWRDGDHALKVALGCGTCSEAPSFPGCDVIVSNALLGLSASLLVCIQLLKFLEFSKRQISFCDKELTGGCGSLGSFSLGSDHWREGLTWTPQSKQDITIAATTPGSWPLLLDLLGFA